MAELEWGLKEPGGRIVCVSTDPTGAVVERARRMAHEDVRLVCRELPSGAWRVSLVDQADHTYGKRADRP